MGAIQQMLLSRSAAGGGGSTTIWDGTDKGANIIRSNGNLDATQAAATGVWNSVFGTNGKTGSGKHQFEIDYVSQTSVNMECGIATKDNTATLTSQRVAAPDVDAYCVIDQLVGWIYRRLGAPSAIIGTATTGTFAAGATITVGLDLDAATPTCRFYENGTLGFTATLTGGAAKTWYPIGSMYEDNKIRIRGAGLSFPIAGYTDWG